MEVFENTSIMKIYSKLMVVDDEPDITFTLKMSLEQRGYSVDVYNDPIEALANFKPDYYVLLLLDVKMPKLNGFELYQELAKIDTKAKVCFFTEYEGLYVSSSQMSECLISKPISTLEVVKKIDKELL